MKINAELLSPFSIKSITQKKIRIYVWKL